MHRKTIANKWILVGLRFGTIIVGLGLLSTQLSAGSANTQAVITAPNPMEEYVVLAWNDLGMHCYNRDFKDLAVLPPFNTLWAQVIRVGDPPVVVTTGINVEFFFEDNTDSVTKSNFWDYDQQLFGINLPANVGLKGKGLSGSMDLRTDHYVAEGIPLTQNLLPVLADLFQRLRRWETHEG